MNTQPTITRPNTSLTSARPRLGRRILGLALLCGLMASPLDARALDDNPDGEPVGTAGCLASVQGTLTATPGSIVPGQSVTLRYRATVPSNCTGVKLRLNPWALSSKSGTRTVTPISNTTYNLQAIRGNASVQLASATVGVTLPRRVTISSNEPEQVGVLIQALGTPHSEVVLEDNVDLDLTHKEWIVVAEGVSLVGGRTPRAPGARLRTTSRPKPLLDVGGDNVRISGIRIEGADMGVSDLGEKAQAIFIVSRLNVEIDHNEISGFSGSAVGVADDWSEIDPIKDYDAVHIHDNFIHHNQSLGRHGYGVTVGNGAYVTIEQNVFDWNRHAIAGDGSDGSGFRAYRNLVLEHGGLHRWIPFPGTWVRTHQFDMHGQENCGVWDLFSDSLYNCGTAGHDMEVRYNSFLYTAGKAVKLRGTPQFGPNGAKVMFNVFAHDSMDEAIGQTESGLYESQNLVGINGMAELGSCDFDADGLQDSFLATGQTWWYASAGTGPWTFLNTSLKRRAEVSLGFFDGDPRCDVFADGVLYSGGQPLAPVPATAVFANPW